MDNIEILSKIALFSLMKKRDLKRISKLSRRHRYEKGDVIVQEGARDGRLFVIISGEVAVMKDLGKPCEIHLRKLGSGTYFGEMALIDDYVRTASVVALNETEVLSLDQWNFRDEIKKYPSVAIELLQTLSRRIRAIENTDC
jgi:CRP/FNR family cyclic AMP-dependent transcriptional regulator